MARKAKEKGEDALERIATGSWWRETTPAAAAKAMVALVEQLDIKAGPRRTRNLRHAKLVANQDLTSYYDAGVADGLWHGGVYLSMNIGEACCSTLHAKVTKARPRVQYLTEKGDYSLKRRAKNMTLFFDGVFHQARAYAEMGSAFFDSMLCGSGLVMVPHGAEDEPIDLDRTIPDEILVDESQAINGQKYLRDYFRKKFVHKETLLSHPVWGSTREKREAIRKAEGVGGKLGHYYADTGNMVLVYEAWHTASQHGKDDGRYMMALAGAKDEGGVLAGGPFKRKRFPGAFIHFNRSRAGLWGKSLMELLVPVQVKLNDLIETIDQGQRLMCVPRIFVQDGFVDQDAITNAIGEIIKTSISPSQAVHVMTAPGASAEMYEDVKNWWKHGFEITGIATLSAYGEKPAGLTSQVALRELLDQQDMRHAPVGQAYEQFGVDIAEIVEDEAEERIENKQKVIVQVPGEKFLSKVDFEEARLPRNAYTTKAFPTSTLPTTPAGKREHALELFEKGAINRAQLLELLDLPDTASTTSLLVAAIENTERAIELMLEDGKYEPPEEYTDLVIARAMVMQAYLRGKNEDVPEKRLNYLRIYIQQCTDLIGDAQEATPGAAAAATMPVAQAGAQVVQAAPVQQVMPVEAAPEAGMLPAQVQAAPVDTGVAPLPAM